MSACVYSYHVQAKDRFHSVLVRKWFKIQSHIWNVCNITDCIYRGWAGRREDLEAGGELKGG